MFVKFLRVVLTITFSIAATTTKDMFDYHGRSFFHENQVLGV